MACPAAAWGQAPPAGDISLSGVVVNAKTGEPIARAEVQASAFASPQTRSTMTDASGGFHFIGLARATYTLSAWKPRFSFEAEAPLEFTKSGEGIHLELNPAAAIAGWISDKDGEPVKGAKVGAMRLRVRDGMRTFEPVRFDLTDDRGRYRLWGLQPDRYQIAAPGYDASAFVALAAGEEIETDFSIPFEKGKKAPADEEEPSSQIGVDIHSFGDVPPSCSVQLQPVSRTGNTPISASARGGTGGLVIADVRPGKYFTRIICAGGYPQTALYGTQDLLVNPTIALAPGMIPPAIDIAVADGGGSLQGKIAMPDGVKPRNTSVLIVRAFGASSGPEIFIGGEDSFSAENLAPGVYTVWAFPGTKPIPYLEGDFLAALPAGERVEIEDGRETGIELKAMAAPVDNATLGPGPTTIKRADAPAGVSISGRITDPFGEPASRATVTLIDSKKSKAISDSPNDLGEYRFGGIEPGTYYLAVTGRSWYGGVFRPVYYPETFEDAEARPIAVNAGDQFRADFRMSETRGSTVWISYDGPREMQGTLSLVRKGIGGAEIVVMEAPVRNGMPRQMADVAPGSYTVRLKAGAGEASYAAEREILIEGDVVRVDLNVKAVEK